MAYDPLLGLWEGTPGDPNIKNVWGALLNTNFTLLGQAITGDNGYAGGTGGINIAGLTTYTLTVTNGAADQARQPLYPFVGALTANCTVTLPASVKIGWVLNATTGGKNVILTTGGGTTLTVVPGTGWAFFYCDGTNVTGVSVGFVNLLLSGNATISGNLSVTGTTALTGTATTPTPSPGDNSTKIASTAFVQTLVSSGANFPSSLSANGWKKYPDSNSPSGYFIEQWGQGASTLYPQGVTLPIAMPNALLRVLVNESSPSGWASGSPVQPTVHAAQVSSFTTTTFSVYSLSWNGSSWVGPVNLGFQWYAIGY